MSLKILLKLFTHVDVFAGNVLILLAIFLNRDMHTPTNFFLASLAVADLAVSLFLPTILVSFYQSLYWIKIKLHIN